MSLVGWAANACADWIADQSKRQMCPVNSMVDAPSSLALLLARDMSAVSTADVSVLDIGCA